MKKSLMKSKSIKNCTHEILRSHRNYEATVEYITLLYASKNIGRHAYVQALKSIDAKLMLAKINKVGFGEIKIKPSNTILSMLGEEVDQYMSLHITPDAVTRFRTDFEKILAETNEQ